MDRTPSIGVLAMQGAFARHVDVLRGIGVDAFELRTREQLEQCDGIVLPGGESTAIRKALDRAGLLEPLRDAIAGGLPAFGTCAGMIVLADTEPDGAPPCLRLLDVVVERNGFGRQSQSSERAIALDAGSFDGHGEMHGVFIRAPRIASLGDGVEVLGTIDDGEPVVVRQGSILAASFHPELTDDDTLHRAFAERCRTAG